MKKFAFISAILLSGLIAYTPSYAVTVKIDVRGKKKKNKKSRTANDRNRMINALRGGNGGSGYFRSVRWDSFSRGNQGAKLTTIGEVCAGNYNCIPALAGAFNNRDARVRNAVYNELTGLGYNRSMSGNRRTSGYYRQLTSAINRNMRRERDRNAKSSLMRLSSVVNSGGGKAFNMEGGMKKGPQGGNRGRFRDSARRVDPMKMERNKMRQALRDSRRGNSYFYNVSWPNFSGANTGAKTSVIGEMCRGNYDCIPPLLGGFMNRDINVRKAIYRELTYLGYSKQGLKRNPNGSRYERMIMQNIANNERRERDRTAQQYLMSFKGVFAMTVPDAVKARDVRGLATMDPGTFTKTNGYGKMTFIGSSMQQGGARGQNMFFFLLDAASYGRGNVTTQQYIVGEMSQAVYLFQAPVKSNMARSIKRKLRSVRNAGIRSQLSSLAGRLDAGSGGAKKRGSMNLETNR